MPDASIPDPARLEIDVLGPLRVQRGAQVVLIGSVKQRLLLGALALHADRVVGRAELIEVLWREEPPRSCRGLIHTYVARLRRLLDADVIVTTRGGYRLMADGVQVDLLRFEELAAKAQAVRADDPASASELLAEALDCWRDRVLADLPDVVDHDPALVALEQRRVATVMAYAELAMDLGQPQQAATRLDRLLHDEPLHEGVAARLMLALAASGQQAAALEVFARLRGRLAEVLGVEPGPELQDAQARVLRGEVPDARSSRPAAAASRTPVPAQLPADVAGFTGRAEYLRQLDAMLSADGGRPPTVIAGTAGVGKTALALHWAHRVAGRFGDGQLYVDLRGYADPPPLDPLQALAVLLGGLGVETHRVPVHLDAAAGLYRSLLAGKQVLVVLDNAHDAEQIRPLLPGQATCLALVTSRDRLTGLVATNGARRLTLDVLAPGEATALLGKLLGEGRTGAPRAVDELARLCARLPLALRIAAANLAGRPGQTIAGYLDELRHDRLAELAVEGDPHAAVQVAFGRSYRRLAADRRRLFRLLGLAPGPDVSVPAAAALAGISRERTWRLLDGLVAAHLVEPRGPGRFGMHDLLREYAHEQALQEDPPGQRTAAVRRLYDWYLRAADAAAAMLFPDKLRLPGPAGRRESAVPPAELDGPASALAWLEAERLNLVAAVQHAAAHGPHPAAWRLADALRGYLWLRRHTSDWLLVARAGLTAAGSAGDLHAQAACRLSLGDVHQAIGHYRPAIRHYTAALTLARQTGWANLEAVCLAELGMVHWWSGDLQEAAAWDSLALDRYGQIGKRGSQATVLVNYSLAARNMGRLREAARRQRRALALHRRLGSPQGMANALGHLGVTLHDLGRLDRAHQRLTNALTLYDQVGDRFGQTWVRCALAGVHRDCGRHDQALEAAESALRLAGEIAHRSVQAAAHSTLASVHRCLGHDRQAIGHDQQAVDLARRTETRAVEAQALCGLAAAYEHTAQPLRAVDLAGQARTLAAQAGFRMLEGQAHTLMAAAHLALGHHAQARIHAEQALALHRRTGHRLGQARSLRVLGAVLGGTGDAEAAAACWRDALDLFRDTGSPEADEVRELLHA